MATKLKLKSKQELMRLLKRPKGKKLKKKKKFKRDEEGKKAPSVARLAKELIRDPVPRRKIRKVRVRRVPPQRGPPIQQPQVMLNLDTSAVYRRYLVEKEKARIRRKMHEMKLSPNTQRELNKLAHIQNKSKTDDYERQRIKREQEIMSKSMSILNTPYIFKDETINPTGVQEDNILLAPNTFKEREDNPHLLKQQRPSILQTREMGNQLEF